MRLTGSVLLTKALRAGEGVSYGYTHRADADTRVALVTGGYAQGVVRGLGDRISVRHRRLAASGHRPGCDGCVRGRHRRLGDPPR